ncbi:hypothetical protein QTH97_30835 [Variovorax sp. J22R24]|nr:hypothetical protein [Variovorax sp. J22R24]MDM0109359.1 hypothetical protein [Variovorax sp. J22R24]
MKAGDYEGPRKISVKDVPDARIERPTDVLVQIMSINICGLTRSCTKAEPTWRPGVVSCLCRNVWMPLGVRSTHRIAMGAAPRVASAR